LRVCRRRWRATGVDRSRAGIKHAADIQTNTQQDEDQSRKRRQPE
jgi:hypothetical protein